jgi:ATP-dependent Zn protease
VKNLLLQKDKELRELSKNLFWYDYLDHSEIERIMKGERIEKERVREWNH